MEGVEGLIEARQRLDHRGKGIVGRTGASPEGVTAILKEAGDILERKAAQARGGLLDVSTDDLETDQVGDMGDCADSRDRIQTIARAVQPSDGWKSLGEAAQAAVGGLAAPRQPAKPNGRHGAPGSFCGQATNQTGGEESGRLSLATSENRSLISRG
jgi:hypothetical protein